MYSLFFDKIIKGFIRKEEYYSRRRWFLNGVLHRDKDKPALISYYTKEWWFKGRRHRDNLPAVLHSNCGEEWWFKGEKYKIKKFKDYVGTFDKHNRTISINGNPSIVWDNGTKEWRDNGILHRKKMPAIEYSNGDEEWWIYGMRHREDGPAVIYGNKQFWFEFGEFIKCTVA